MPGNSSWMPYAPQGVKGFYDDDEDDDEIKMNEMSGTCGTYECGERRGAYGLLNGESSG